jgi:type VI secretion system protein ImpB
VTYNVEIGDAIELKEIPFVMGIMGDLSGQPAEPLAKSMKPRVAFSVENRLSDEAGAGNLGVDLTFKSLEDFEPEQVARKIAPLRELLELRTKLSDLVGSLQGNEKLDRLLQDVINNTDKLERAGKEIAHNAKGR